MPRHKRPASAQILPVWVKSLPENAACLRSVAEETYTARNLAKEYGADDIPSCVELIRAGDKEARKLENSKMSQKARCEAGSRAYRKFWEAKVCARRVSS
jgi:hypothetical protein